MKGISPRIFILQDLSDFLHLGREKEMHSAKPVLHGKEGFGPVFFGSYFKDCFLWSPAKLKRPSPKRMSVPGSGMVLTVRVIGSPAPATPIETK